MKKVKYFAIIGIVLIALQIAAVVFDLITAGGLKFDGSLPGLISYLSPGLVGVVVLLWGFVIAKREE